MSNKIAKVLIILWVVQKRNKRDIWGNFHEQVRFNPWNPLAYLIWLTLNIWGIIVLGFRFMKDEWFLLDKFFWK